MPADTSSNGCRAQSPDHEYYSIDEFGTLFQSSHLFLFHQRPEFIEHDIQAEVVALADECTMLHQPL